MPNWASTGTFPVAVCTPASNVVRTTRVPGPAHLFSNPPAGSPSTNLTVRLSRDEGRTWPLSRVVDPNRCRYSDLAVSPDGTILCLYTNGETGDRDRISIARFNMEWLLETATAKHR